MGQTSRQLVAIVSDEELRQVVHQVDARHRAHAQVQNP